MSRTEITSNAMAYLTGDINASFDLSPLLGDYVADYDLEGLTSEYSAAVEQVMQSYRPDWVIAGDFIFGDFPADHLNEQEAADLKDELDIIDVNAMLDRHERGE